MMSLINRTSCCTVLSFSSDWSDPLRCLRIQMNRLQLAASTLLRNARVAQSSNFRTLLKYKSRKDVPAGLCSYVANGRQERTQTINASESFDAQQQRILSKSLQHVNELGYPNNDKNVQWEIFMHSADLGGASTR